MKKLFRPVVSALALSSVLPVVAFAAQPVRDAMASHRLEQLNATAQVIDNRLQQILIQLNQSAQNGTCWLDGKAFSQGAGATVSGHAATCSVQSRTGWPEWRPFAGDGKDVSGE